MGIFHDMVTVVNRAPVPLTVRFDGQEQKIEPGETSVPRVVVPYAKNQNPVMGSADADNPNITGAEYLIGVKGSKDNCTPLTEEEWNTHLGKPCRIDMDEFMADRLGPKEKMISRGKGRKVQAKSSFDAGVRVATGEVFAGDRE